MRIGIDARLWGQTGVGRYIRNLVDQLSKIDKKNSYVLFVPRGQAQEVRRHINKDWRIVETSSRWHSLNEQIFLPKTIEKEKIDLMHFPYFSVPLFYKGPFVVTIHDLILHHFFSGEASTLPLWLYGFKMIMYRLIINAAAKKSKRIIAVSESTKREIVNNLGVSEDKIGVIYEAADDFEKESFEKIEIDNYLLFVGNVYPHKNVERLIQAFKFLSERDESLKLVFVGKNDFFYERLRKRIKKLVNSGKIVFDFDVNDAKLSAFYKNALCLVRPSLMEGFSLPPLEALFNKCLVVASDIPVHREIFKDSIIYFDSYNANDIAHKINYTLNLDKKTKDEKIKKGLEIANRFSWNKTARQTLDLYESSLGL